MFFKFFANGSQIAAGGAFQYSLSCEDFHFKFILSCPTKHCTPAFAKPLCLLHNLSRIYGNSPKIVHKKQKINEILLV
jgi:hypothetical protein